MICGMLLYSEMVYPSSNIIYFVSFPALRQIIHGMAYRSLCGAPGNDGTWT